MRRPAVRLCLVHGGVWSEGARQPRRRRKKTLQPRGGNVFLRLRTPKSLQTDQAGRMRPSSTSKSAAPGSALRSRSTVCGWQVK